MAKEVTIDGNTVTTTYGYNAANELISIDGVPITYKDGNQLHTGSNSLEFNALGQLLKVYTADGQQLLEQYEYNADGLRIAKLDGSGNVLEQYIYNGSKLAYVTDGGNNLLYYFTRNASGTLLSFVDCTKEAKVAYWYVTDAHGNVVGLTNASGELVVTYSYDAWGNELSSTGTVTTANGAKLIKDANPFRYSGYYYDQAAGLYYLNARYYSPELGRFLSRDPAHMESNLYSYCGNEPIMYADADGLAPLAIVFRAALTAPSLLTFGAYVIGAALVFTAIEYGIPALVSFAQSFRAKSSSSVSASVQPTSGGSPGSPPEDDKDKDKYTKDNFRRNLIKHTGRVVTAATQAHHIFPKEFEPFFKTVGIQIHNPKYGVWLEKTLHLSPHHKYNAAWTDFILRFAGEKPSTTEVIEFGRKLMDRFYGGR